jgi:hypothetical protein
VIKQGTGNGERGTGLRLPVPRSLFPVPLLVVLVILPAAAAAQIPPDSIRPDTLTADTSDVTGRYLEVQKRANEVMATLPLLGVEGPRPQEFRVIFDRDSIDWSGSETLGDLLRWAPDLYIWRGGWVGRPLIPNYMGRGGAGVEYYLDGLPFLALGPDSVTTDPGLFPLSLLEKVVVERWPGLVRIKVFTRQHDRRAPASRIGISTGDHRFARYIGALEQRFGHGFGYDLSADIVNVPLNGSTNSEFNEATYRAQFGYVPNNRFGVSGELLGYDPSFRGISSATDTLLPPLKGKRQELQLRASWGTGPGREGFHADGLFGASHWDGTGVNQTVRQGGVMLNYRRPRYQFGVSAFNRSRATPWDLRGSAGWQPHRLLTVNADLGYLAHDGGRNSHWIGAQAGLQLPAGFSLVGQLRDGQVVTAPNETSDTAQQFTDWRATFAFDSRPLSVAADYGKLSPFETRPVVDIPAIDSLRPSGEVEWVTLRYRLAPVSWLVLSGWYTDPVSGTTAPDGTPPGHSLTALTFRSRFWRHFKSGTFELKAQIAMETWSAWTLGLDQSGQPIRRPGATFLRSLVEFRIQRFMVFWDRQNLTGTQGSYTLPGLTVQPYGNIFGFRWDFLN